jgi:hypothetical protein
MNFRQLKQKNESEKTNFNLRIKDYQLRNPNCELSKNPKVLTS